MARPTTPKLSIATREFIDQRARKGNGSVKGFESILGRLVRYLKDIHVGSVQPHHLEKFFYGDGGVSTGRLRKDGSRRPVKKSTLGKYRGDLKVFFDWCHRRSYTTHPGVVLLEEITDTSTINNRDRFRMERNQLIALMDAAEDPRDRALIAFVANTGVRIGEALSLTINDLRLNRGEVYVTKHKTRQEVTYALSSDLESELRQWLTVYSVSLADNGKSLEGSHFLFPAKPRTMFVKGEFRKIVQPEGYNPTGPIKTRPCDVIRPIAERAGVALEDGDGWHTIRRSIARIFYDDSVGNGHDGALRLTQSFLGHKFAETTEGYIGLDYERQQVFKILQGKPFLTKGLEAGNVSSLAEHRNRRETS